MRLDCYWYNICRIRPLAEGFCGILSDPVLPDTRSGRLMPRFLLIGYKRRIHECVIFVKKMLPLILSFLLFAVGFVEESHGEGRLLLESGIQPGDTVECTGDPGPWRDSPPMPSKSFYGQPHLLPAGEGMGAIQRQDPTQKDWVIGVFLLCILSLALARFFFPGRIRQLMKAALGQRFFFMVEKESLVFRETPAYLLNLNFLLLISLLSVQTMDHFDLQIRWTALPPLMMYLGILLFFTLLILVRRMITSFLAWVFQTSRASRIYISNLFLVNQLSGVLLLPLIFYHAYNPSEKALFASWILLIVINIYKVVRGSILSSRLSGFSPYYLILYLCAVEIAPLLIIGKSASLYLFNYQ